MLELRFSALGILATVLCLGLAAASYPDSINVVSDGSDPLGCENRIASVRFKNLTVSGPTALSLTYHRITTTAFDLTTAVNGTTTLTATDVVECARMAALAYMAGFSFNGTCTAYTFIWKLCSCSPGEEVLYVTSAIISSASPSTVWTNETVVSVPSGVPRTVASLASWQRSMVGSISTDIIQDVGDFHGIMDKGLTACQVFDETQVSASCECRARCLENTACAAFSLHPQSNGALLCRLAKENVYVNTPSSFPGASYFVKKQLVEPWAIDRLIYRSLDTKSIGFYANKAACEAIPGFRLVAVKFQAQIPIMLKLCLRRPPNQGETECLNRERWFYVDMVKINNVPTIQGKTPLSDTDLTSSVIINDPAEKFAFIYARSGIHDENVLTWNVYPVCQANVFGVNW